MKRIGILTALALSGTLLEAASGTVFKGVCVHNVAELVPVEDGRQEFHRVSGKAHEALSDHGKKLNACNTGVEFRFVMKGDSVRLRLGGETDDAHANLRVYWGDIIADWPELTKVVHGRDCEIVLPRIRNLEALKAEARARGDRFDPEVVRLIPIGSALGLRDAEGAAEPPPDMLPKKTYLAYGSSITHGSNALAPETCYASLVGADLGADVRNLGFAGSAWMEPEVADYIAGEDFDFASFEFGVNVLNRMKDDEFERRVRYFVKTVAASHPKARILVTDIFGNRMDASGKAVAARFREIVRRVVGALSLPNVRYANGLDLLPDGTGISVGSLHPAPDGHRRIATGILARFRVWD